MIYGSSLLLVLRRLDGVFKVHIRLLELVVGSFDNVELNSSLSPYGVRFAVGVKRLVVFNSARKL